MAKKLSEQALIRANRVEKSIKIIKRTCSSIRDLRVVSFDQSTKYKKFVQLHNYIDRSVISRSNKLSVFKTNFPFQKFKSINEDATQFS